MIRAAEFTLSLIAVIFLTIAWIIGGIITFFLGQTPVTDQVSGFWFFYFFIYSLLSIPLLVLLWVSTFKIKEDNQKWGIFTLVMGVIYTFSVYFIPGVLLFISGILMVTRNQNKSPSI
ncbi:hypothetical protein B5V89_18695 [Heyndrickxia sporothermodurans]|uniref:DUF4064 domain-containing protein n=1 Tax=Heyndrickxia sporothermodurans TaxID=46224 RepID=UPI000D37A60B|nr:DUF4064 domain-containing protein [Heyndrickxia sporothermodurans]PTY76224.1 hypothetical protein B5V89_18695 [Heyndrickxia sporothermodurans]